MYEEFYGLKDQPFRLSPDPAFFFGSKGHKRALAYLRYGLNQKEGFIVITGAPGTGKTTLARALLREIGRDKIIIAELNTTHLDADDVLRMVAASFGLEHEGLPKATLLKRLESFFISRTRAGYHLLLLVDEAQNLPYGSLEELRMLSNFYLGKEALLQIFLLGQEQFRNNLYTANLEQLRQRVVASSHLEPLNQQETREYIEHRLKLSGWKGNPQITDRAFVRLYSLTKGVPRRINTFCERLLLFGAMEELTEIRDDTIKAVAKELMYEVSAKGVKLSDIKPGVPKSSEAADEQKRVEQEEDEIETQKAVKEAEKVAEDAEKEIDSEMLSSFSDEVTESSTDTEEDDSVVEDTTNIEDVEDEDFTPPPVPPTNGTSRVVKEMDNQTLRVVASGNAAQNPNYSVPQTESPLVDTKPDWWDLVALAVSYYREPEKHKNITSSRSPIPSGIYESFKIAIGKMTVPEFLRTGSLANTDDQLIKEAIRFYIKNVLLSSTADYYRRLGVSPDAGFDKIRTHYKYLFRLFQPDKEQNASNWDETYTRRINQAYGTLRSSEKRKEYDDFLAALAARNKTQQQTEIEEIPGVQVTRESIDSLTEKEAETTRIAAEHNYDYDEDKKVIPWLKIILVLLLASGVATYFVFKTNIQSFISTLTKNTSQSSVENIRDQQVSQQTQTVPVIETMPETFNDDVVESKNIKPEESVEIAPVSPLQSSNANQLSPSPASDNSADLPGLTVNEAVSDSVTEIQVEEKTTPLVGVIQKPALEKRTAVKLPEPVVKPKPLIEKVEAKKITAVTELAVDKEQNADQVNKIDVPVPAIKSPVAMLPLGSPVEVLKPVAKVEKTIIPEAKPVAMPKKSAVKSQVISKERVKNFITDFSLAYEEGNLDAFMTYFAADASTNDAANKAGIRKEYQALYDSTEMRVIDLDNVQWKIKKHKAIGKGDFTVTVLGTGGGEMKSFSGLIKLEVVSVGKELKIKGMYHAYESE